MLMFGKEEHLQPSARGLAQRGVVKAASGAGQSGAHAPRLISAFFVATAVRLFSSATSAACCGGRGGRFRPEGVGAVQGARAEQGRVGCERGRPTPGPTPIVARRTTPSQFTLPE